VYFTVFMLDVLLRITNCYLQAVTSSNQTIVVSFCERDPVGDDEAWRTYGLPKRTFY